MTGRLLKATSVQRRRRSARKRRDAPESTQVTSRRHTPTKQPGGGSRGWDTWGSKLRLLWGSLRTWPCNGYLWLKWKMVVNFENDELDLICGVNGIFCEKEKKYEEVSLLKFTVFFILA